MFDTPFSTYIESLTRYNVETARFNGRGTYHRHDWQSSQLKYWSGTHLPCAGFEPVQIILPFCMSLQCMITKKTGHRKM